MTSSEAAAARAAWAIVRKVEKENTVCQTCPLNKARMGCSLGTNAGDRPEMCDGYAALVEQEG